MAYTFYLTVEKPMVPEQDFHFANETLEVDYSRLHPAPLIVDDEHKTLIVLGTIIDRGKVLSQDQIAAFDLSRIEQDIKNFNGQFAIYYLEKSRRHFHAFTDRTASYPIFYFQDGPALTCSLSYSDIWKRDVDIEDINKDAFYEFLILRRLMGVKTYDHKTQYLSSFSHLFFNLNAQSLQVERYDTLDFEKFPHSFNKQAKSLAERIKQAIESRTSDAKQYGLMLSGGMDSRVPMAVKKGVFTCFTIGHYQTNEYRVATEAAALDGHPHHFIQMPANHHDQLYPSGIFACGGMRDFHAASWSVLGPQIAEHGIDVLLSGYALDYLLGDNYLPRIPVRIGRHATRINQYRKIDTDLAGFFLDSISWRYKTTPVNHLFSSNGPWDFVHAEIQKELSLASTYSELPFDQYLFMTVNNLSRHSMYIESSLSRPYLEDRVPGLDRELFDFGLKIPYAYKSNYKLYKKAVSLIDPRYLEIPTANTNYKAKHGPYFATYLLLKNMLKQKWGLTATLPPARGDRNWGDDRFFFEHNTAVRKVLADYKSFVLWDFLPKLNTNHIFGQIEDHLSGKCLNMILMNHLLTVEVLLKEKRELAVSNASFSAPSLHT